VTKFNSKFDLALGQFTDAENRGYELFQANCASCHSATPMYGAPAALFTTYGYANIGVPANPTVPSPDLGLGGELGDTSQDGKFKIPTLRNIAVTAPYSHNGGFPTLYDMVSFISDSRGFVPDVGRNVSDAVGSLNFSEGEIADLIAFLNTLTDD
jgi:cytochrome c peroxidase